MEHQQAAGMQVHSLNLKGFILKASRWQLRKHCSQFLALVPVAGNWQSMLAVTLRANVCVRVC